MKATSARRDRSIAALGAALALGLAACATSPFQRAGNADDVAGAVARSQPPAAAGAQPGVSGPGRRRRRAARRVRSRRLAGAVDPAGRGDHAGWRSAASVLVHGSKGTTPNGELVGARFGDGRGALAAPVRRRPSTSTATLSTAMRCSSSPARPRTPGKPTGVLAAYDARTGRPALAGDAAVGARGGPGGAGRSGRGAGGVAVRVALRRRARGSRSGRSSRPRRRPPSCAPCRRGSSTARAACFCWGATPRAARATRRGTWRAQLPAFVRPTYDYDHYRPEQNEYSALDRNRVLWRVTVADGRAARSATVWPSFTTTGSSSPSTRRRPRSAGPTSARRTRWPRPTPVVAILFVTADGRDRARSIRSPARGSTRPGCPARWCGAPPSTPRGSRRPSRPRPARRPICSGR